MHISNIIVFAIVIAAISVALALLKKGRGKTYRFKKGRPLSNNEQAMYWKLVSALPEHAILAQVNMTSFLRAESHAARMTISQKSIDFLVCDKAFHVVAAIEIDDRSHSRADRQKADKTKNAALEAAGIKLIRWPATPLPDSTEIVKNVIGVPNEKREIPGRVSEAKQPQERQPDRGVHGVAERHGS